jgi:hypothetical protein
MSSSDMAKIGLVDFFSKHAGIESKVSDWKRTAKIKYDTASYIRRFENTKAGITAFVDDESLEEYEGEGDHLYCHEGGDLYVDIHEDQDADGSDEWEQRFSLMFVSKTQWEREGYFPDQHWGFVLEAAYDFPEGLIEDEVSENTFVPSKKWQKGTREELIAALEAVPGITIHPTDGGLRAED